MIRARTVAPLASALLIALTASAAAPQLPVSRDHQHARARGTRSPSGAPGARYWQNHARYAIDVGVAPADRSVRGSERIVYFNNSPDTLKALGFKLILNIHRPGASRMFSANEAYLTPGVTVDSFAVNGRAARWPADTT